MRHKLMRLASLLAVSIFATAARPHVGALPAQSSVRAVALDTALELASFDSVWRRIRETYYDSTMRGLDWLALREELRPRVARAKSRDDTRAAIGEMLSRLRESHFSVIPGDVLPEDEHASLEAPDGDVGITIRLAQGAMLVTRVDSGSPAARAGVRTGWSVERVGHTRIDQLIKPVAALQGERERRLAELRATLHAAQLFSGPVGTPVTVTFRTGGNSAVTRTILRREALGELVQLGALPPLRTHLERRRLKVKDGCIGLISFNVWMTPIAPGFDDAMNELRDCNGIVLDVRGNIGGVAGMVMGIAGYFFDSQVSLGTLRMRTGELRYVANPRRVTRMGLATTPYAGPLALLVDELSASTTEIFAGALQSLGRARLFGRVTAGQALPSYTMRLPNGDALLYVIADFVSPDGKRLEGPGVVPDISLPLRRERLLAGQDEPLQAAIRWIGSERSRTARSQ